jgi:uncharacterized NAD(P)/FAD-binding protein YdhS
MAKETITVFVGGGVGNIFCVSAMVKNLAVRAKSNAIPLPKQKLIIIDRGGNFGGGIPWGKDAHLSYMLNSPPRINEPREELEKWISNNLEQIRNYLTDNAGKVGRDWLAKNENLLINRNFNEVYFPRRIYGFFLEEQLYQAIETAEKSLLYYGLEIEIQLVKATVQEIYINADLTKQIVLKDSQGYEVKCSRSSEGNYFPKIFFQEGQKISHIPPAAQVCLSIGILPSPKLNISSSNNHYVGNLYAKDKLNWLKQELWRIHKKYDREVTLVFLGSSATFLDSLLEIESDESILKVLRIIALSKQGQTRQAAIISPDLPPYKPEFLNQEFKSISSLIAALKQEYTTALAQGYKSYDVWYNCLGIFQNKLIQLKNNYPQEFAIYLETGFTEVRKLTNFTNPETIAVKERLEKRGILYLEKAKLEKIKFTESGEQITLTFPSDAGIKEFTADILINSMGEDKFINFVQSNSLMQSLLNCGVKLNESQNGFLTDKNQHAGQGIYLIGRIAFGNHHELALRYTHLKSIYCEGLRAGKALSKFAYHSTLS